MLADRSGLAPWGPRHDVEITLPCANFLRTLPREVASVRGQAPGRCDVLYTKKKGQSEASTFAWKKEALCSVRIASTSSKVAGDSFEMQTRRKCSSSSLWSLDGVHY